MIRENNNDARSINHGGLTSASKKQHAIKSDLYSIVRFGSEIQSLIRQTYVYSNGLMNIVSTVAVLFVHSHSPSKDRIVTAAPTRYSYTFRLLIIPSFDPRSLLIQSWHANRLLITTATYRKRSLNETRTRINAIYDNLRELSAS